MSRLSLRIAAGSVFVLPNFGVISTPLGPVSDVGSVAAVAIVFGALALSFDESINRALPDSLKAFYLMVVSPTAVAAMVVLALSPELTGQVLGEVAAPLLISAIVVTSIGLSGPSDVLRSLPIPEVILTHMLLLGAWAADGFPHKFLFFASQKNVIGGTALAWVIVLLVRIDQSSTRRQPVETIGLVSATLVVFASGSRTALGGILLAFVVGWILRRSPDMRSIRVEVFVFGLFAIPWIYLSLGLLPFFETLDKFVLRYTGNPVYSGREEGWRDAVANFDAVALFGTGSSQSTVYADGSTLHAHNLGLVRLYSSGLLAALLLSFFFVVLSRHARRCNSPALLGGVLGITVHQLFEANFTVGGVPVGIALAFTVGLIGAATAASQQETPTIDLRETTEHNQFIRVGGH